MVEVTDRAGLESWLKGKPREVAVTIAARAALRVFPYAIIGEVERKSQKYDLTFITARALLIASVAPFSPTEAMRRAAVAAFAESASATDLFASVSVSATDAFAASASASATDAASAAGASSASASTSATSAASAFAAWKEISKELTDFNKGAEVKEVLGLPLWQLENPLAKLWQEKRTYLNADHTDWSFWIDLYQRLLDGRPQNWKMLEDIALIDPKDWDKGADYVNRRIAEIQARYAVKETVEAAQKVLAEYPVASAQMGHNNPPEDIEDDPFTAEDAVFVQKMLDDISEESESSAPDVSGLRVASDGLGKVICKVGVWLAGKLDIAADAFFKELGGSAAKYAVRGGFLYLLIQTLQPVIEAVGAWLPFIGG